MNSISLSKIGEFISNNQTFALMSHINPDGDAIGSVIALGTILEAQGKQVYYRNQDGVPESLAFLPDSGKICTPLSSITDVDVLFALDCAKEPRLGKEALAEISAKVVINIDHHKTNTLYGDYHYIDSSSAATAQIIYELAQDQNYPIPASARDNIYVGIATDTDSFRTRGTSGQVHNIAAELIAQGLDVAAINQQIYENTPFRKVQLLKEYLNTLQITPCGNIADWSLTQETKERLGIQPGDNEDMVNYMTSIDTVKIACSFEEQKDQSIRISLRSKSADLDVSSIASNFGGGGHSKAAGIILENTPISVARKQILAAVSSFIVEVSA
jgi:phosphoesterase RecJ-like protein